jgi:hypothetical protein
MHPKSLTLLSHFPNMLLMDCTYKTNVAELPFLHIVGVTSTNQTFTVAGAFISSKKTYSYLWALKQLVQFAPVVLQTKVVIIDAESALMNAVQAVLPNAMNLLCQWHVEKNVGKNVGSIVNDETICDKFMMSFRDLLHLKTEGDFDANLTCLGRDAGLQKNVLGAILEYINTQWIPHKHHFIKAWADQYRHYNHTSTSINEGAHGTLKRFIAQHNGSIPYALECFNDYILMQTKQIEHKVETDMS